ncbi:MAG: Fpg/Nei family DNA glycosylase [Anderseniella sp.]|nr:Fpg/Nei family DNA glycosylase [Anderseniella sp.]
MPEGHTIHRAALEHNKIFGGHSVGVTSPQGRFTDGAARLDGQTCSVVEAIGKHLIYHFENGSVLHIHLGLFGRIRKHKLPLRTARGAVRVRLVCATHAVDINGPTICEILDDHGLSSLKQRIGPDVLRRDAEPIRAFRKIKKSRRSIGCLIMDQSVMAGIGNIYRTEILWRESVHPLTLGRDLDDATLERLWLDARKLLEIGVRRNAIVTVDSAKLSGGRYRENTNIFGKEVCPSCEGVVSQLEISGRRVYLCDKCQPLVDSD